jgi:SAM-dependent methyltransferase
MYEKTARYYDAIYSFKDYEKEATSLLEHIHKVNPNARRLLDVACGTGKHLSLFKEHFECEGLDYEADFVRIARERNQGMPIHQGDFRTFDLGKEFDVVTCLFSAIGYAATVEGLDQAIAAMARHLTPGGVLLVEPWLFPEGFKEKHVAGLFVDQPDLKIARVNNSRVEGRVSVFDMHHIVGTPDEVHSFVETHALTLFTHEEYSAAFVKAGLHLEFDPEGPIGRGLYIGVRV